MVDVDYSLLEHVMQISLKDNAQKKSMIFVADNTKFTRVAMAHFIKLDIPNTKIVETSTYGETVSALKSQQFSDILVLDINIPGMFGDLSKIESLHKIYPNLPILAVSNNSTAEIIRKAINLGAKGYFSKSSCGLTIGAAIQCIKAGEIFLPPEILIDKPNIHFDNHLGQFNLSEQEVEISRQASEGKSNKKIAYMMTTTKGSIKLQINKVFKKMNVPNRVRIARNYYKAFPVS